MNNLLRLASLPIVLLASCASDAVGRSPTIPAVPARADDPTAMEVVPLQYAAAQEMAATLNELTKPPTRIVADPRTNSLIVQASPEDLPHILELIRRLDHKVE